MYLLMENVLPGMVIERSVVSNGVVLLNGGTEVSKHSIQLLKDKGIKGLYIEEGSAEAIGGYKGNEGQYKYNLKSMLDFNALASAKGFVKSSKVMRESLYPVISEIIQRGNEWINTVDFGVEIDEEIFARGINTCVLSIALASQFDLANDELLSIGFAALFCDLGMLWVPKEIRDKSTDLNSREKEIVASHCRISLDFVRKNFNLPMSAYQAILDHHERWDGSGYPEGRKKESISKYARIIMVADVYDALINESSYHPAYSSAEAIEFIMGGSGTLFDPRIAMVFANKVEPYPVGTCVCLSDGSRAVVQDIRKDKRRPLLRLQDTGDEAKLVDLSDRRHLNLTISSVVKFALPEAE